MKKETLCITIEQDLFNDIQTYAKSKSITVNKLIEDILIQWQNEYKSKDKIKINKDIAKKELSHTKNIVNSITKLKRGDNYLIAIATQKDDRK